MVSTSPRTRFTDPNWEDVMTYCSNEWMSDFTYEGIRSYLVGLACKPPRRPWSPRHNSWRWSAWPTWGAIRPTCSSVYLITQANTLPLPDPWRLDDRPGWGLRTTTWPPILSPQMN